MSKQNKNKESNHESDKLARLEKLGWYASQACSLSQEEMENLQMGRISMTEKDQYRLLSPCGEFRAMVSGRFRHFAMVPADFPTTGDWVLFDGNGQDQVAVIRELLSRKNQLTRIVAGRKSDEQLIAANVDHVLIVTGLDGNFNPRRIERYLSLCREWDVNSWVILNKADLLEQRGQFLADLRSNLPNCSPVFTSTLTGEGLDRIAEQIQPGETLAFVGSSGVGKSSLINSILNVNVAATAEVRETDSRGRHTTTRREMFFSDDGYILIDTPGMRELQLAAGEDSVRDSFSDISNLSKSCRFHDCTHSHEPGCAVLEAIEKGVVEQGRLTSHNKQLKEARFHEKRGSKHDSSLGKKRWKAIHKSMRNHQKPDGF